MKRYIKYITLVLTVVFMSVGCTNYDDINKNPYVVYEAKSESFVQPMIYGVRKQLATCNFSLIGELMQYTVNANSDDAEQLVCNYVISEGNTNYSWNLYSYFGNAQYMLDLARKECAVEGKGNPAMIGVALIMRSWIGHIIADTYGNVPYSKAGTIALQGDNFEYTTPYDDQKDIYIDLLRSLEEANSCFEKSGAANFKAICDFMYDGKVEKWRRFGNALYLRLLMRVANKVIEESGGIIYLGEEYGYLNVVNKINEIYDSYLSGAGSYPVMRYIDDSANLQFSSKDSALYTPFYRTTSALWNGQAACSTLVDLMLVNYKSSDEANCQWDPRYFRYFDKSIGCPPQMSREEVGKFFDTHKSSSGNSLVGRYPGGGYMNGHTGDLKLDPIYAILNYDEILFNFAEAGARGWIPMTQKDYKNLYLEANLQNILQWQVGWEHTTDYYTASSPEVINWINYLDGEFDYNRSVEMILRQKYVALFWVGAEPWSEYRRTGYPVLKTNGVTAQNKHVLPTRMRYPATEAYQNVESYNKAINGWLGGENNMITDVWWASTVESQANRRLGRK